MVSNLLGASTAKFFEGNVEKMQALTLASVARSTPIISSGLIILVKLPGDNYMVWKNTILPILSGYDILQVIQDDPPKPEDTNYKT